MTQILDQFGRPYRPAAKPVTRTIAAAEIRDRWSDYPSAGLTPSRLGTILKEADTGDVRRQAELFEEMEEKDTHLFSQLQTRKLAVQGLRTDVLPRERDQDHPAIERIVDFCAEALEDIDLDEAVLDMLDAIGKGYSMLEINWDASEGQAAVKGLEWIHPKKLTFVDTLTPRILTEDELIYGIEPPPWKTVYHRYKARSGYDTRAGLIRVCAWMYLFKNYDIKDWVAFAEVYGQPLRVGKYDQGASRDDKDALIAAVRSIGSDAAGIISKATEIEFIEASKTGSLNIYQSLADFCDKQMSKAILGQTLTSDSGSSGSYALGKVHNEVRQDLVEADATAIQKTITRQILRPLVGFNFGWDAPVPQFKIQYEPPEDQAALALVYKELVAMGFDLSQEHVAERFSVPMRAADERPMGGMDISGEVGGGQVDVQNTALNGAQIKSLLDVVTKVATGELSKESAKAVILVSFPAIREDKAAGIIDPLVINPRLAEAFKLIAKDAPADSGWDYSVIETAVKKAMAEAPKDAMIDPIQALVEKAGSLEELKDQILKLKLPAAEMGAHMQRAIALARLMGRFDASQR